MRFVFFVCSNLVIVLAQDVAFIYGVHTRRAKVMLGSVWWGLVRGCFFIGILIFLSMYAIEVVQWMSKYENTIANIKPIQLTNVESRKDGISAMVISVFALGWLFFAALAGDYN